MIAGQQFHIGAGISPGKVMSFFSMVDRRKQLHNTIVDNPPDYMTDLLPASIPYSSEVERMGCVFVRIETVEGQVAWGCAAFDPALTGETLEQVTRICQVCADRALDLNPINTELVLDP